MDRIKLNQISRKYEVDGVSRFALKNVTIAFGNVGLVSVVGKSGSGKSTLINLIALLDKPTSGSIYFNHEDINNWSNKQKRKYHNKHISIIFQHYHLIEDLTAIENVMLPLLINGEKEGPARKKATKLLESISFSKELYNQKCFKLSGGEKQRVAICRSLINEPEVILADEPTGALDSKNAIIIMDLLKALSKDHLVILVSHNQEIVNKYSDRIISLKEGEVVSDEIINKLKEDNNNKKSPNRDLKESWLYKLTKSNFLRRKKRDLISFLSLAFCLNCSFLIIGFSNGSDDSIKNKSYQQIDYGVSTIYKESKQAISDSKISLVKMSRPSKEESIVLKEQLFNYHYELNYDSLISPVISLKLGDEKIEDIYYYPVYSYIDTSFNKTLIIEGTVPKEESLNEVVINKAAYKYLCKKMKNTPLNMSFLLKSEAETHYYTGEETNPVITDYFVLEKEIKIIAVVDELDFLSTPKIYYSYLMMSEYLKDTLLVNLSAYFGYDISWLDRLNEVGDNDALSSYSYRLFLKDYKDYQNIENDIANLSSPFVIDNDDYTVSNTLLELVNASSYGMSVFLVIALLGSALILGIVSYSSYSEDKKQSAILTCLGASNNQIKNIYLFENLSIGLLSLATSFIISPLLALVINEIVKSISGLASIIKIPFASFMSIPFALPLLVISLTILICILSTSLPITFSKKINLKEELMDE